MFGTFKNYFKQHKEVKMCGICGIFNKDLRPINSVDLLKMRDSMINRGPDDAGIFIEKNIGLGSRRLSIIDLSLKGHMPMHTPDERYWIVYNGEVYNFIELRQYLEAKGVIFRSHTDTEVILQLYAAEGPSMLSRCNGMFAIAIWDSKEKTLFLARDRTGTKPLFFTENDNSFLFASEEKALFENGIPKKINTSIWNELLIFRYVAGEQTPYENVKRLLPGHYLILKNGNYTIHKWWDPSYGIEEGELQLNSKQISNQFDDLFSNSIALRQISDVPIGALLSGGLDSSSLVAKMTEQNANQISTFTVRFSEPELDEGDLAKLVANKYKAKYNELFVPSEDIPSLLEDATRLLDEPIVHGNDLQILAISRFAKHKVSVLLSGEGADEIFGGYVRYRQFLYPWAFGILGPFARMIPDRVTKNGRLHKINQSLSYQTRADQLLFASAYIYPNDWGTLNISENDFLYRRQLISNAQILFRHPVRQVMYYEQLSYLQSVLDRNDRMTMGASIECREPFLDTKLMQWALRLPVNDLFSQGVGKYPMRLAMSNKLPPQILHHKKWGFAVPWKNYFRIIPALRSWIGKMHNMECLQTSPVSSTWVKDKAEQFLKGDDNLSLLITQLVMFTVWYKVCIESKKEIWN